MSIGASKVEKFSENITQEIRSRPEELIEQTRDFRETVLKRIQNTSDEIENRCETHPDTEFRIHTADSAEGNRKEIRLLADSIVLFERNNGVKISRRLRENTEFERNLSKKISNYTVSSEKQFDSHFHSWDAWHDTQKDVIVLEHLPIEIKPPEYPNILEPLINYIFTSRVTLNRLEELIIHEMTHSYLTKNSELKSTAMTALKNGNYDIAGVSYNNSLSVVDECFANLTAWTVSGNRPSERDLDEHPEPEKIVWGTRMLIDRARTLERQINIIDWARKTETRVFDKILQKGQAEHSPMEFLLEAALPKTEFRKLRKLEKIVDEEVQTAFKHLKKSLEDAEKEEMNMSDKISYQRVEQLEEEVDWHNPDKMKSGLLDRVIEKGVENRLSLQQVKEEINYVIENEAGRLKEYAEHTGNLEEHIDETEIDGELEQTRRELLKASKDIESLN